MISTVAIETERGPSGKPVTRSRINGTATACHYPRSGRIVLVADRGEFTSALEALVELAETVLDPAEVEAMSLRAMLAAMGGGSHEATS